MMQALLTSLPHLHVLAMTSPAAQTMQSPDAARVPGTPSDAPPNVWQPAAASIKQRRRHDDCVSFCGEAEPSAPLSPAHGEPDEEPRYLECAEETFEGHYTVPGIAAATPPHENTGPFWYALCDDAPMFVPVGTPRKSLSPLTDLPATWVGFPASGVSAGHSLRSDEPGLPATWIGFPASGVSAQHSLRSDEPDLTCTETLEPPADMLSRTPALVAGAAAGAPEGATATHHTAKCRKCKLRKAKTILGMARMRNFKAERMLADEGGIPTSAFQVGHAKWEVEKFHGLGDYVTWTNPKHVGATPNIMKIDEARLLADMDVFERQLKESGAPMQPDHFLPCEEHACGVHGRVLLPCGTFLHDPAVGKGKRQPLCVETEHGAEKRICYEYKHGASTSALRQLLYD